MPWTSQIFPYPPHLAPVSSDHMFHSFRVDDNKDIDKYLKMFFTVKNIYFNR